MTPATMGKDFGDMPTLAPLRKRLCELVSPNIFVGTSSWKYEGWLGQLYFPNAMNTGAGLPRPGLRRNAFPNTPRRFGPSASMQASIGSRTRNISATSPARSRIGFLLFVQGDRRGDNQAFSK